MARSQDQSLLTSMASHENLGRTFKWDEDMDAKIKAVTLEQANAALRKYVNVSNISIVKAGDFKAAGVFQQ